MSFNMPRSKLIVVTKPARGLVRRRSGQLSFDLVRYAPDEELSNIVEHYWVATWSLGDKHHDQEILASGAVAAVVDSGQFEKSGVSGPITGVFIRSLTGSGRAFGIKFRPTGIRAFYSKPVSTLTDTRIPFSDVFGAAGFRYEQAQLAEHDDCGLVTRANEFLLRKNPVIDDSASVARRAYLKIEDPSIQTTASLAESMGMSERTIQRYFREYVGVTPKWAIKRFRFQDALKQLQSGQTVDFTQLAHSLGYFDQSHFNHEFKAVMGCTPSSFARGLKQR